MDNQYVIYDAEKEKPPFVTSVLGFINGVWQRVWCGTTGAWFNEDGSLVDRITHWTSLPPNPPKPKRWVKKEILHRETTYGGMCREVTFRVPVESRDHRCTYEIEEES